MTERAGDERARPALEPGRVRPRIQLPSGGPPAALIAVGAVTLAVTMFAYLEDQRAHRIAAKPPFIMETAGGPIADPPPLDLPRPLPPPPPPPPPEPKIVYVDRPGPSPPPVIQYIERPAPSTPAPAPSTEASADPALLLDTDPSGAGGAQGDEPAVAASLLRGPASLVPQGTVIPAVLETPLNSARAGPARALTTGDTRGFDGERVLIPKGSRLIGEVSGEVQSGHKGVMVTWTRLIRPDGAAIRIASPASDPLGGAGVAGQVNNHALARLSNSVLQTAFVIGADIASRPTRGGVYIGLPNQAASALGQVLVPDRDANRPTITVKAGARITIFVAKDLDFSGVPLRRQP